MTVKKRTFEALKHAEGSAARAKLNRDPLTSDAAPAFKYLAIPDRGAPVKFKTKEAAEAHEAWEKPTGAKK